MSLDEFNGKTFRAVLGRTEQWCVGSSHYRHQPRASSPIAACSRVGMIVAGSEKTSRLQFFFFTPLLTDASPRLGIWSRALAKVASEPDVLFHVLRNKPKLVESAGGSKKRNRDDE